jgi:hypothetical protein
MSEHDEVASEKLITPDVGGSDGGLTHGNIRNLPGGTEEDRKDLFKGNRSQDRDFKQTPTQHEGKC